MVIICTTPFPAKEPYKEEPAAPFITSIVSISSTAMSLKLPLFILIIPSIMIKGFWLPLIEVEPLNLISGAEEGLPEDCTILTPEILPRKALAGSPAGTSSRALDETLPIEKPKFLTGVPIATPVITTSSNKLSADKEILISDWSDTKTSCAPYPIKLNIKVEPSLASMV